MTVLEICLIIFAILVVGAVFITYLYKRAHNIPTGCDDCHCTSKKKMLKKYNKMYHSKGKSDCKCQCKNK